MAFFSISPGVYPVTLHVPGCIRSEKGNTMKDREPEFKFADTTRRVLVWDIPTRAFHWLLVGLMVFSIVCAKLGGNWMEWHKLSGYAILGLLMFRVMWGLVGSHYSRFTTFIFGPRAIIDYLRGLGPKYLGHNPLGSGSVFALLGVVAFQAVSGLFANDDISLEGPLFKLVGKEWSDRLTGWHKFNEKIIYALVALHVAAILFYWFKKKENLVGPMLTGYKSVKERVDEYQPVSVWLALLLAGAAAVGVWWLVTIYPKTLGVGA
jgi:cytochrome b